MTTLISTSTAIVIYTPQIDPSIRARTSMEKIQNVFMERSFRAQFQDYRYFHGHGMGDVTLLVGTSTAGKTSIIKALQDLEPDCVEDGGDLRTMSIELGLMRQYCPSQVAVLEMVMKSLDIPKAIFSEERSWQVALSDPEKLHAEELIRQINAVWESLPKEEINAALKDSDLKMFDDAFERSRRGISTIFDELRVDNFARHALMRGFNGPKRVALVYCPFHVLSSRMRQRNQEARESGKLENQRIGTFPLEQFSELYTQKPPGASTLEMITREQAMTAFGENFDNMVADCRAKGGPVPPAAQIEIDKRRWCEEFLTKLGFKDGSSYVEVSPRDVHHYDLFINSYILSPKQLAQILHAK